MFITRISKTTWLEWVDEAMETRLNGAYDVKKNQGE